MDYYLKEDYIGSSSSISYAKKGDLVTFIKQRFDMVLVEYKGRAFWINVNNLTTENIKL